MRLEARTATDFRASILFLLITTSYTLEHLLDILGGCGERWSLRLVLSTQYEPIITRVESYSLSPYYNFIHSRAAGGNYQGVWQALDSVAEQLLEIIEGCGERWSLRLVLSTEYELTITKVENYSLSPYYNFIHSRAAGGNCRGMWRALVSAAGLVHRV
ncbi:hypothetical protein J6590_072172 [Homalodisca vitripennis]|nr:hypothetical protein J6590_072172 [Homalodisca vitripennis]